MGDFLKGKHDNSYSERNEQTLKAEKVKGLEWIITKKTGCMDVPNVK
jgi:hypothetical protein